MTENRCGTCTLCCRLTAVPELNKPVGQWCRHCDPSYGCGVYNQRPPSCRSFECHWYAHKELDAALRPDALGIVFESFPGRRTMLANVDARQPLAWREPAALAFIETQVRAGRPVIVHVLGKTPHFLLPQGWTAEAAWQEMSEHLQAEAARVAQVTGKDAAQVLHNFTKMSRG